jgi:bifunctional non-homologous end joining protein LigD
MPAHAIDKPPSGPDWLHEIKHDGYRLLVRKRDSRVRMFTRRGFDCTHKLPPISDALAAPRAKSITIDGEAVWCDPKTGLAIIDKLHSQANNDAVFLYAFDLLELDGIDWRDEPLEARKTVLAALLSRARPGLRFNAHLFEDGAIVFRHAASSAPKASCPTGATCFTVPAAARAGSRLGIRRARRCTGSRPGRGDGRPRSLPPVSRFWRPNQIGGCAYRELRRRDSRC